MAKKNQKTDDQLMAELGPPDPYWQQIAEGMGGYLKPMLLLEERTRNGKKYVYKRTPGYAIVTDETEDV